MDETWKIRAACRGHRDPDIFHCGPGEHKHVARAKAVCARCPVRPECLNYGLDHVFGIWGGLTERERKRYKRGLPVKEPARERQCVQCKELFAPVQHNQKFCSGSCGAKHRNKDRKEHPRPFTSHGTSSYNLGCRCDICKAAATQYRQRFRQSDPAALPDRQCRYCKTIFTPRRVTHVFCCLRCARNSGSESFRHRQKQGIKLDTKRGRPPRDRGRRNSNERGSAAQRRKRKQFLLDRDGDGITAPCSDCMVIVNFDTMIVDRIKPGNEGGKYTRDNIKIHCQLCSTRQGSQMTQQIRKSKAS